MAKKRSRITNPEPFLSADNEESKSTTSTSRKRPKPPKLHQQQQQVISSGISSKILKEALIQQKEIEDEEAREQNPNLFFAEEPKNVAEDDEEEDIDDFGGSDETRSQFGGWEEDQIDEDDEKLPEAFLSTDSRHQRTLADIIVERIKEKDAQVSSDKSKTKIGSRGRAAVVVLGDIGRSPRMQYHALSLARQACLEVDIVAYGGSEPHSALLHNQSIHLHKMTQWPTVPRSLPKILRPFMLMLKPLVQFLMLLWYLCFKIPAPDVFLVQNPPSVPTLVAVKWASWLRHSAFIVDWHNFGYTLLSLTLGRSSIFVTIYRWIEKHYGRMASGAFCVTKAMQHELDQNWGVKATVLYDQPPEFFRPASIQEKHELCCRIGNSLSQPYGVQDCISYGMGNSDPNSTLFTTQAGTDIIMKQNRPAVIVSSTSWTPDEDFGILLEAALMYDRRVAGLFNEDDLSEEEILWNEICSGKHFLYPRLLFIITGKGPEKEKYEEKIRKLKLKRVAFRTMWLSAEDYPLLLGSADLGVCLHTSSSGLDLPMKVVDMFGCGLPVCAVSYSCIEELVEVDRTGLLFSSSSELADQLMMLFKGFPNECDALSSLREGVLAKASSAKWATGWEENAKPLISEVIGVKNN